MSPGPVKKLSFWKVEGLGTVHTAHNGGVSLSRSTEPQKLRADTSMGLHRRPLPVSPATSCCWPRPWDQGKWHTPQIAQPENVPVLLT